PAGADEHWKTARTALFRIRSASAEHDVSPQVFYVGAAVEEKMAQEIWGLLETGAIANAANLNDPDQLASFCEWLIAL
ncbi:MAG: hypothetical protein NUV35_09280, partial [Syntrophomonadaceae bacterium]|nr:hypothetical protein [Syntrophomonadaceae bacterium]